VPFRYLYWISPAYLGRYAFGDGDRGHKKDGPDGRVG
jgi:hypothetical protein